MLRSGCAGLILWYQRHIRYLLPYSCRFTPSCSEYTRQAILKHGVLKGIGMGLNRLFNCHPFSGRTGYDPI